MRRALLAAAPMVAAIASACSAPRVFHCEGDAACVLDGVQGRCEPDGFCSLPDAECDGGFRYADQAPDELAGVCVAAEGCGDGPGCCDGEPCPVTGCAVAVAAGLRHSCAVTDTGAVFCWGDDALLQLGSAGGSSATPREVTGVSGATAIAAGDEHACALLEGGDVVCWGNDDAGQLGLGTVGEAALPGGAVVELAPAVDLAAGAHHTCAVDDDDSSYCWGDNAGAQVLDGEPASVPTPVETSDLLECPVMVAAGGAHSAAVLDGGDVLTWGTADSPALGRGDVATPGPETIVIDAFEAAAISAGALHTCAVDTGGGVRCWGIGADGRLGVDGGAQARPIEVPGLSGVDEVRAGGRHTCARAGTALSCWGAGDDGQLGVTGATSGPERRTIAGAWRQVSAGGSHTCAVAASGEVDCWGSNADGQLGRAGPSSDVPVPVAIPCE